ncbi:MAG: hypothetical protein IH614_03605 [Desulfuromonadales bacterium]|nr:hypothetical protein [Desulfuromonadales bacterium]
MRRFRFTILAVCLVLLWLGGNDLALWQRNPAPEILSLASLEEQGAPREWLRVTDTCFNLERAISMSGDIPPKALLVPLTSVAGGPNDQVWVETREPAYLELMVSYHILPNSEWEKEQFRLNNQERFHPCRDVEGMLASPLIATANRNKLLEVLKGAGITPPADVLLLSEAKEPPTLRGVFFFAIGLLGLLRVFTTWRRPSDASGNDGLTPPSTP